MIRGNGAPFEVGDGVKGLDTPLGKIGSGERGGRGGEDESSRSDVDIFVFRGGL